MSDTPRTDALIYRKTTIEMQRHELLDLALALERELVAARAEIVLLTKRKNEFSNGWDAALEQRDLAVEALRLCNVDQFTTAAELAEAKEELNDRRKFAYAVEQALDGMKGDYVEIIKELRKDAERYRWLRGDKRGRSLSVSSLKWTGNAELSDAAVDAAMKGRRK